MGAGNQNHFGNLGEGPPFVKSVGWGLEERRSRWEGLLAFRPLLGMVNLGPATMRQDTRCGLLTWGLVSSLSL